MIANSNITQMDKEHLYHLKINDLIIPQFLYLKKTKIYDKCINTVRKYNYNIIDKFLWEK